MKKYKKTFLIPLILLFILDSCYQNKEILIKQESSNKISNISPTEWKVYTEIIINAPREEVWKELTNFKDMPNWSKSLKKIEGELKKNSDVVVHFVDNNNNVNLYKHKLIVFEEGKSFGWSDPFLPFLKDNHVYLLQDLAEGKTKLIQTDEANGFSALFLGKIAVEFMLRTYTEFNQTLKERVEKRVKDNK